MIRYVVTDQEDNVVFTSNSKQKVADHFHVHYNKIQKMIDNPKESDPYKIHIDNEGLPDYVWTVVSKDEYELPLGVFDRVEDLAKFLNVPTSNISSAIIKTRDKGYNCRYKKIYIGEENE